MVSCCVILKELEQFKEKVHTYEYSELDVYSKNILKKYLTNNVPVNSSDLIKIQAVLDYMHEQINIGNWREVKEFIRKTITIASYIKLLIHLKISESTVIETIKDAYKIIDYGIIFGCSLTSLPNLLQECAAILNSSQLSVVDNNYKGLGKRQCQAHVNTAMYNANPIKVITCPSMEFFYKNYISTETPVVLTDCINHWPALTKWQDQNYFINLAGSRTVPIEIGSKYTDSDWTQKLMTVEEFIKKHVYECNGPIGYLAQYQLFQQIPELRKDIVEPEYCCFCKSDTSIEIMAWYGPKGTVSPLHHDPKKNLLAQVVGEKQIFMFSPEDSQYLYCHEHELLNNTAKVDPRQPDLEKYPNYKEAKPYHCVLSPGQMLYIPPKWWHFVESLSISFSVSFWWD